MQAFGNVCGNNGRPIFKGKWKISSGANQAMGNKWGVVSWILSFQTTFQPNQQKKRSNGVRTFFLIHHQYDQLLSIRSCHCIVCNFQSTNLWNLCNHIFSTADYLLASSFVFLFKSIVLIDYLHATNETILAVSFLVWVFQPVTETYQVEQWSYCLLIILPIALFQV